MSRRLTTLSLLCFFLCDHGYSIRMEAPQNATVTVENALYSDERPSNLLAWYRMMHSFVDNMYMPGRTPLIIIWLDQNVKSGGDSEEVLTQVNREGQMRMFQNPQSVFFIVFLILFTLTLIISGWFICGYRIIGLCGTRPSHPLDNDQAVFFRIVMLFIMIGLMIGIIILIYFAAINTTFANDAFSSTPAKMNLNVDKIDVWVSNFSKKYKSEKSIKKFSPTKEDILKAVTDAYRDYYGYVFSKSGFYLVENEIKVLAKYTYYTFQSYYHIMAAHEAYENQNKKIKKMKNAFKRNLNQYLNVCSTCEYYQPFRNKVHFNTLTLKDTTLKRFISKVSELTQTDQLFNMHNVFISKKIHDVLRQIPNNKSLYTELVTFLKNASDTYYAKTYKQIQISITHFVTTFERLTKTLHMSSNRGAMLSAHYARHTFTIIFCIALLIAIAITMVALVLGCLLPPRPLSEELQYDKYRCRELPATMLNVSAMIVFITILCIFIFVMAIFIVGVPYEWGFCQFLTGRHPNSLTVLPNNLRAYDSKSPIRGLFSRLLGPCKEGRDTMFEMLHLQQASNWNTTYAFLKKFKEAANDIFHVPELMDDKFPEKHSFLNFCDFYDQAMAKDDQTSVYQLPSTTLNLKLSNNIVYKSHELPLAMRDIVDTVGDKQANKTYKDFVKIVANDLLLEGLKKSFKMAHPWRYLGLHLKNAKDLYNKTRRWFYSSKRINSTKNMFLKYSASSLNILFEDILRREMSCSGIGTSLNAYFLDYCYMFIDPWNATWLIFLIMLLLLLALLLGLFVLIISYRKQSDRRLSDLQHFLKKAFRVKYPGDDIQPKQLKPKKEKSEESDSDKSVAIIGFSHGCYIFCRTFTICSNFLVYLLLCKWKDRKKRAKRMNADPKKRRTISELPDNFFPAPVVVPLGCGPHLVGKCCCLNLEEKKKSELEEEEKQRKEKKSMRKKKKKKRKSRKIEESAEMDLRNRLLNEAREEREATALNERRISSGRENARSSRSVRHKKK